MIVYDEWKNLTLSQFWGKKVMDGIIRAISEELQEVFDILQQIRTLTDIDKQEGVNLDNIGDIVCVTRDDAREVLLKDEAFEMTDELYRKVLKFMIAMHNSSATYYDIINGLRLIWDLEDVRYSEDRDRPASYTLDLGERDPADDKVVNSRTLTIRAAGVNARYLIRWLLRIKHDHWETDMSSVDYQLACAFFDSVRKIDGSLQLNGTYMLDAATEGRGCIDYSLAAKWPAGSACVEGVEIIPDRLMITSGEIRVARNEAAVTGRQGNIIAASVADVAISISTEDELLISNREERTALVGNSTELVRADGYLVSGQELYGAYTDDGLQIHYAAEAVFDIEMAKTKIF